MPPCLAPPIAVTSTEYVRNPIPNFSILPLSGVCGFKLVSVRSCLPAPLLEPLKPCILKCSTKLLMTIPKYLSLYQCHFLSLVLLLWNASGCLPVLKIASRCCKPDLLFKFRNCECNVPKKLNQQIWTNPVNQLVYLRCALHKRTLLPVEKQPRLKEMTGCNMLQATNHQVSPLSG